MASGRPRVAVDANVLIASVRTPRWPYEVLRAARLDLIDLVLPDQVIDEAWRNLYPPLQAGLADLLEETPHEVIPVPTPDESGAGLVRDESDVPIAMALIEAQVEVFVTNDRDFTDPGAVSPRLSDRVRICLPAIFLRDVLGWSSEELEAIRSRDWRALDPDLRDRT